MRCDLFSDEENPTFPFSTFVFHGQPYCLCISCLPRDVYHTRRIHFDTRRDYGDCFGYRATYGECKQTAYCRPSKQKIEAQVRIDLNRVKCERSVNSSYFNLLLMSGLSKERDFNLYGSYIVAFKDVNGFIVRIQRTIIRVK